MRSYEITDKKILKEQQELVDRYMSEAPDNMDLVDYLDFNGSEYFKEFYKKRRNERKITNKEDNLSK